MDAPDPLETGEPEEVESKILVEEMRIKGPPSGESDDEERLAPRTLLETGEHEVQYSIRSPEGGMITYRVLQVDESNAEGGGPHLVATAAPAFAAAAPSCPQVLGGNLNGQLYVIGNANEMFAAAAAAGHGGGGARAIAPRTAILETGGGGNSVVSNIKKRDERRRATHNEVERRRRDKINNWISKLATIIPENGGGGATAPEIRAGAAAPPNGHYDGQSKGGILAKACDYIVDLKTVADKYETLRREHDELSRGFVDATHRNVELERENKELRAILKKNGLLYVPGELS